jgi:hypothetical protein
MVFINEWFPNPAGSDAKGEFVELFNNGEKPVSLNGWSLATKNGKQFPLSGYRIAAGGYLILPRSVTKLTLKNNDETLMLRDAKSHLVDQSSFSGAAPDGQSFNRVNYGTDGSQHFAFGNPTPGAANSAALQIHITNIDHPLNIPLNQTSISGVQFASLLVGTAALVTGLIVYTLRQNENLSQLFFGRN